MLKQRPGETLSLTDLWKEVTRDTAGQSRAASSSLAVLEQPSERSSLPGAVPGSCGMLLPPQRSSRSITASRAHCHPGTADPPPRRGYGTLPYLIGEKQQGKTA